MPLVLAFAFIGGLLTVVAPCSLPIVPLVLGAGATGGYRRALGIMLGFGSTFVALSVLLSSALVAAGISTNQLRAGSALALGFFGAFLALPALGDRLASRLPRFVGFGSRGTAGSSGLLGGLATGAALGFIWAPCVGPIMASVIAVAATSGPSLQGLAIALAYVAGAALPLFAIAVLGRRAVRAAGSPARRVRIQQAFGVLMIAASVVVVIQLDVPLENTVTSVLPAGWAATLDSLAQGPGTRGGTVQVQSSSTAQAAAAQGDAALGSAGLPAPIASSLPAAVPLDDLGFAPELRGITAWINSPPLTMASLRGKVVLVHFWTFDCINCRDVQPYVKAWYARYAAAGLVVVGVHTPELSFERDIGNVRTAVADGGVTFPVAFDPAFDTWNAYANKYWPASYFVDRSGHIRHVHYGEGDYAGSEQVIRELLSQN
jgi:cytochrome c biogenesis protein CcdA/thiol-disulfide isomerase/thioredoxin